MTAEPPRVRRPIVSRVLSSPWLWSLLCLGAALPFYLGGAGLDLVPFLLALVGGWLCGAGVVSATLRVAPAGRSVIVHAAIAVVSGGALAVLARLGDGHADGLASILPEPMTAVALLAQLAAIPAVAWIWFGLIGRASGAFRSSTRRAAPEPPTWESDDAGALLRFSGVPIRVGTLTVVIIVVALVVAAAIATVLVAFDGLSRWLGPQLWILAVCLIIALPCYLLFAAVISRRALHCTVIFGTHGIRLGIGGQQHEVAWQHVELLRWRCTGDFAGVEIRGAGIDASLVAGLTRMGTGSAPRLPELSRRTVRMLEQTGLLVERSRRGAVTTFRRWS